MYDFEGRFCPPPPLTQAGFTVSYVTTPFSLHSSASDELPSGADVQAVHDLNADNVPTIFAVVGVASISYLQMRPTELPLRMTSGEDT